MSGISSLDWRDIQEIGYLTGTMSIPEESWFTDASHIADLKTENRSFAGSDPEPFKRVCV